jgi:hypothetical protein
MTPGRRPSSLFTASLLLLGALGFACKDRLYDFGVEVVADGGRVERPSVDVSFPDAPPIPDGASGTGGRGGSMGGTGGSVGGAGGTGGGVVMCSNSSPDRQNDVLNCGTCFNSCVVPNSTPACVTGQCRFTCFTDFYDADGNAANGCECVRTNAGVEACDGLDNDCDGMVDEGFNFMTDVLNCGGCGVTCSYPFATATCMAGSCRMGMCLDGFYDRDPMVAGCETSCQKTNAGVEICDGQDNDCNGVVDNSPMAGTVVCRSQGVCSGVQPTCMGQNGWGCVYPATFQDLEDTARGCDGLDNDCDGRIDEAYQIGQACIVGSGPCAGTGTWVCDNTMAGGRRCMGSMKQPGTEVCNGLDDDCDGVVDELGSASNRTTDDRLVYFASRNVTMFAYEASRYDATATNAGFDSARRPCAVAGRQPWASISKEDAEAACERIGSGWRLCTAAEWADACNGSGNTTFPYGNTYNGASCNGWDYVKAAGVTTVATGAATACVSDLSTTAGDELYDMSGNVKEWVLSTTTTTGPFEMRGGGYNIASFTDNTVNPAVRKAPGLQCDATTPAPMTAVRLPSVGFRCCRTGQLPP